jgi:hypothetical protein
MRGLKVPMSIMGGVDVSRGIGTVLRAVLERSMEES